MNTTDITPLWVFWSNFPQMLPMARDHDPYSFWGLRPKVKGTVDKVKITVNVYSVEIKLFRVFWSNLAQMLPKRRGWFWRFEVKDQDHNRLFHLVNTIEIRRLSVFLSYFARMSPMMSGWTLLIFRYWVKGQGHNGQIELTLWTQYRANPWVHFDQTLHRCCLWWVDELYDFFR